MYICNCNALSEKHIEAARKAGVQSWQEVYAFHGCETKCGKCVQDVARCLNKEEPDAPGFFVTASLGET